MELLKGLPDESVDCIITDPPYQKTHAKWDKMLPMTEMFQIMNRIIKPNGAIILFGQGDFTAKLIMANLKYFRYDLIFQKTHGVGFLSANVQPLRSHESLLVYYKKKPHYTPQMQGGFPRKVVKKESRKSVDVELWNKHLNYYDYDSTERHPRSVLQFKSERQKEAYHPCQKPLSLLKFLIKSYTREGQLVLDATMGSGSTCVAALETGRSYIGIERDPHYFKVATDRIERAKDKLKEKDES